MSSNLSHLSSLYVYIFPLTMDALFHWDIREYNIAISWDSTRKILSNFYYRMMLVVITPTTLSILFSVVYTILKHPTFQQFWNSVEPKNLKNDSI